MKTVHDLEIMKMQKMQVHSDKYNYFLREMENDVLTKENGRDLVRQRLEVFDEDVACMILRDLLKRGIIIEENGKA